jgi:hypothetical protein
MHTIFLIALIGVGAASALEGQIISEALLSFPSQTESVEYDNLALLRTLPEYTALQKQFSGKPLEQAKVALNSFNIGEEEVSEMVVGTRRGSFYGLLSGAFNGSIAAKVAQKKAILPLRLEDTRMYCPGAGTCLVFLDDGLLAFGTPGGLKAMLRARESTLASLNTNRNLTELMNATDPTAPVRGVALGDQFSALATSGQRENSSVSLGWSRFSSAISLFGYSVTLKGGAHIKASLECKSALSAAVLKQTLALVAHMPSQTTFKNVEVSSSDNMVELAMDSEFSGS